MIIDARSLPADETVQTTVCIVGGGVAGIALAREFVGRRVPVCILENGGVDPEPETQSLAAGDNVGLKYFTLETARAFCFGGSSTRWDIDIGNNGLGVRIRPLDAIDFEKRNEVPFSGWPFDKSQLDPYYERAQAFCRVEPADYSTATWADPQSARLLPLAGDRLQTVIFKFARRETVLRERRDEVAQADNVTTYLHAHVLEIETEENGRTVRRLRAASSDGKQFWVTARVYVVANGGIEAPRLLLLSNKVRRNGLGNAHDLVGRFFMEHLHFWDGVFVPSSPRLARAAGLYANVHTVNSVAVIGKLALTEKVLRREKLLNGCLQLIPCAMAKPYVYPSRQAKSVASLKKLMGALSHGQVPEECGRHFRTAVGGIDDIIGSGCRRVRHRFGPRTTVFLLAHMLEQVPNPDSRVTLSSERDRFGQPRARLDWRVTEFDLLSSRRADHILGEELQRSGLGQVYSERNGEIPSDLHGGYHHMGTTRMHLDPKQGVVDADCRLHGVDNLFIAGPSVFPTGGYANPVLTIVALSMRLADHLKQAVGT
ncbi:MAG TPA: GMC family oxidoreductase [Verrucomicrobiae bacterium]|nr:GMC family oxidoreductase [Verrucomicrobiae bacterium]